jgi:maleylacetoacetate isomerase
MKIYTFWRSLATMRVRIALNLKGLVAEPIVVDLMAGHQAAPEFAAINPQKALPALVVDGGPALFQSMAILEYLDETHPTPPLLPSDARGRARVRGLAQIAVADAHPLVVPRVRAYLEQEYGLTEHQRTLWARHWMGEALAAIEGHLARDVATGQYCHGDNVTLADVCLASQVVGFTLFGGEPAAYPVVSRIFERTMQLEAFASAHPRRQPDAPKVAPG